MLLRLTIIDQLLNDVVIIKTNVTESFYLKTKYSQQLGTEYAN